MQAYSRYTTPPFQSSSVGSSRSGETLPVRQVVFGPLTAEQTIAELNNELRYIRYSVENPSVKHIVTHIRSDVGGRPFNPFGPADTDSAISLQHAYEYQGIVGLATAAQHLAMGYQADADIQPSKNYEVLTSVNGISDLTEVLLTMHWEFVEHLVRGDLMWQYFHSTSFREMVNFRHSLSKFAGTYVQALVQSETIPRAPDTGGSTHTMRGYRQKNPHEGAWLTGREIIKVYNTAIKYLPSYTGPDQSSLVKEIDEKLPGWTAKTLFYYQQGGRRRYVPGSEQKLKRWLITWEQTYVTRILALMQEEEVTGEENSLLDEPLRSCPMEIGFGSNVLSRAQSHDTPGLSNPLWTFFQALVQHQIDPDATRFRIVRFQVNRLTNVDDIVHNAKVSDVGMTVIARSEWHQGGFNPAPAGGAGINASAVEKTLPLAQENFDATYTDPSVFMQNRKRLKQTAAKLVKEKDVLDHQLDTMRIVDRERGETKAELEKLQEKAKSIQRSMVFERLRGTTSQWMRLRGFERPGERSTPIGRSESVERRPATAIEISPPIVLVPATPPADEAEETGDTGTQQDDYQPPESEDLYGPG